MVQRYGFFVKHAKKHVFDELFVKFVLKWQLQNGTECCLKKSCENKDII